MTDAMTDAPLSLDTLAPGVLGYTCEEKGELWIPLIHAETPGSGQVAAYLDSLPRDRTVIVPNVLSPRLAGMLLRRGFDEEVRWIEEMEEAVDLFVRYGREEP